MTEVIRIEPRIHAAYSVLTMCYRDLGEQKKALTFAIFGAHLRHDAEEWHALAKESKELGLLDQALVCLTRSTKLDPENLVALWDRAALAQELENLQAARSAYLALLERVPHDTGVLAELKHILIEFGELQLCADLYQKAFEHYTSTPARGDALAIDPSLISQDQPMFQGKGEFTLMDILVLADLYNTLGQYGKAIKTIRFGCRWLEGRESQTYWDSCSDDREFDLEEVERSDEQNESLGSLPMKQGFYPIDINARHRLAIARLKAGDIEEGQVSSSLCLFKKTSTIADLYSEDAFENYLVSEHRRLRAIIYGDCRCIL